MLGPVRITVLSRRWLLAGAAAVTAIRPTYAFAQQSQPTGLQRSAAFEAELSKLLKGATPAEGGILLELPEIAENGNFVPVTITVESPMTEADHVSAIHILSTANPVAHVATFYLSPLNGIARVQSRMRLAKTQEVIALAEHASGKIALVSVLVKVTLGGCAG